MQIGVNELWNKCLMIIREDISEHNFNTWFTPIVPLKFSNNTLTLEVPSQFFYEWLEENYVSIFRKAIDLVIGKNGMLEYSVVIDKGDRKNPPITFNLPTNHSNQNTYNSYSDKYSNNQPSSAKNPFQFKDLDSLVGFGREQAGCSIGKLVAKLDAPLRSKLNEIMRNEKVNSARLGEVMLAYGLQVSSSDVLRRHRRRLLGRDGCKCPNES
jgi:hypothetical protein